jgi:hypothetical protein
LEVNIALFLRSIGEDRNRWEEVRAKFDWMYDRIQIPEARLLAEPLHADALQRLKNATPQ